MAKTYDHITDHLRRFIEAQHLFFVATAPLSAGGHVNLSPKGIDTFRVLSPNCVGYVDLTGSGNETSAHIHENGRITFMFCAFEGPPNILRLYGQGRTVLPDSDEWAVLSPQFPRHSSARQLIMADIHRVQTSCGYGVPLLDYAGERDHLFRWAEKKGAEGLEAYKREKNVRSIDDLPAPLAAHLGTLPRR